MNVKIGANNILYWGRNALLFFHRKFTDLEFMARVRPDVERIWAITRQLEAMYREWNALEAREWTARDGADGRRSRRCSSGTWTWRRLRRRDAEAASSPPTPT